MSPERRPKWWDELAGYRFVGKTDDGNYGTFVRWSRGDGHIFRYVDLWTDEVHDQLPEEGE